MNRIKIFVATLVLSLAGAVYAAGDDARHKAKSCSKDRAAASCCAPGASCCEGGSCCAAHESGDKQTAEQVGMTHEDGASCCAAGAECCKGGSCCAQHKQ